MARKKEANPPFSLPADFEHILASRGVGKEEFEQWVKAELHGFFQNLAQKAQEKGPEIQIPITLISQQEIGNVGAVALYLRDTRAFSLPQIAKALNRNVQSISACLRKAEQQTKGKGVVWSAEDFSVPIRIVADPQLSMLEAVVAYLREQCKLQPWRIAALLQRDQRVIATVWQCVKRKREVRHG